MAGGEFQFEDCLLKHFIRREAWLPRCRERKNAIARAAGNKAARRLKYFTFCAVGALDVLLLDREKVLKRSANKEFDTVYFFDRSMESVIETRKRIPGANGFPGDFVEVVLNAVDGDGLETPINEQNTGAVRKQQQLQAQRKSFIEAFPFDVLNLDVEQYLYRPREELPGKLTQALREILEWQKRAWREGGKKEHTLDSFALMLTTRVGPQNLPASYLEYLRDVCLQRNIDRYPELREPFARKANGREVGAFFRENFDGAFKLAVPKSLIELALEADWHIDGDQGVDVFQFDRTSAESTYRMLHMVMTLRRQAPPRERRLPGQGTPTKANADSQAAIRRLFEEEPVAVDAIVTGDLKEALEKDLERLFEHRKHYYKGD
jgi:hypothetical protein